MESLVLPVISALDRCRAQALRWGLSFQYLRAWFLDRPARLFFLFSVTSLIYLPLTLYFPLWVLAIGPLIWGIPHLFSSLRYQSSSQKNPTRSIFYFLFAVWLISFLIRLGIDFYGINLTLQEGVFESCMAAVTAVGLLLMRGFSLKKLIFSLSTIITLFYFTWFYPLATAGFLILAHNFVAFIYWIFLSPTLKDRRVAVMATFVFTLVHALVLLKVFDPMINWVSVESFLAWAELDIDSLGRMMAPWSQDGNLFYRLVVLYAFGQSLHYFVWMKAIPDLYAPQAPTSFRMAWKLLKKDFGRKILAFALILLLVPLLVWALHSFALASQLYFAAAAFHGYMEIAGFGVLFE